MPTTLILFNKPYGVLSQFRQDNNNNFATLSDFFHHNKYKDIRVAGRLDATSEGLLLLTNNGKLNQHLTHPPKTKHDKKLAKTYWVQLDGLANNNQINQLRDGVMLSDGKTLPAIVEQLDTIYVQQTLWQAPANIAKRKITSWLSISILEGKNRQIRRMTAHVGLPCLRLIRVAHSHFCLSQHLHNPHNTPKLCAYSLAVGEFVEIALTKFQLQQFQLQQLGRSNQTFLKNQHIKSAILRNKS
ncbi:pseudouridine synthase [Moraxella macacae]|nr:pseudouridine synthase [Moraxella macacae]